ncbi:two-component sensor histidine kinase [Sphaerisporangium rufum]|uniref:Two-component sensor histidine kinase n=1 Tax=Sphaerisporangium rufum TaxID=1381558 RepID=A0A919R4D5_9ACTN|nr:histidine kinase [Sphaerisporangium rufum]GII78878.1 two-component sensor histidine kinase [Sphaerisporangium rufum]
MTVTSRSAGTSAGSSPGSSAPPSAAPRGGRAGRDFAAQGPTFRGFLPWLSLLAVPVWDTLHGDARPVWLAVAGIAGVTALYVYTIRLAFTRPGHAARWPLPALGALVVLLNAALSSGWQMLFLLLAIACGVALTSLRQTSVALGAVMAAAVLFAARNGEDWSGILSMAWGTFTAGLVPAIILRLFDVIAELRATREELARAAVEQERLRFSRDLHDLLGHTLSVMVVKAEAVRRLLPGDTAAAAGQAADIERTGRDALTQVRAAVTGYRGRGLAAELDAARAVLADAGVTPAIRVPVIALPPETDALLGWAVREGVTNLIRHSGARSCRIDLTAGQGRTVLSIQDDGRGGAGPARSGSPGHGLPGLRERVEAAGGELAAADGPEGGFHLQVILPEVPR